MGEAVKEAVLERIRKDKVDEQWNKYHEAEVEAKSPNGQPTEKQKTYILTLAKTVGLKVDVSTIRDKQKASLFIERLKTLSRRMNGNGYDPEVRDKRVAFGMATKLVFRRYCEQQKEPTKWKRFWKDVNAFYRIYQKEQELAVGTGGDAP